MDQLLCSVHLAASAPGAAAVVAAMDGGAAGSWMLSDRGPRMLARGEAVDVTGVVLDGCGHWIPEERPRETAESIVGFVSGR